MSRLIYLSMAFVAVCGLLVATGGGALGAHHAKSKKDTLVVKISTTGSTVWGKVHLSYKQGGKMQMAMACEKASCTYHLPHMVKIHLSETPTNKQTWPFKDWTETTGGHMTSHMGSKLTFEIMGSKASVKAVYVPM